MQKTLIAAGLLAALGGFAVTGVARADDFSGTGQHPKEHSQSVAGVPMASDAMSANPTPSAAIDPYDVSSKSHGHP